MLKQASNAEVLLLLLLHKRHSIEEEWKLPYSPWLFRPISCTQLWWTPSILLLIFSSLGLILSLQWLLWELLQILFPKAYSFSFSKFRHMTSFHDLLLIVRVSLLLLSSCLCCPSVSITWVFHSSEFQAPLGPLCSCWRKPSQKWSLRQNTENTIQRRLNRREREGQPSYLKMGCACLWGMLLHNVIFSKKSSIKLAKEVSRFSCGIQHSTGMGIQTQLIESISAQTLKPKVLFWLIGKC